MSFPDEVTFLFVETVPSQRKEGVVYISIPFSTAIHSCLCGCGMKVVTPIRPHKWTLTFNGETISLHPSIGNWSFACQSHYVIRDNRVIDAGGMSKLAISRGRAWDETLSERHFDTLKVLTPAPSINEQRHEAVREETEQTPQPRRIGFWGHVLEKLGLR